MTAKEPSIQKVEASAGATVHDVVQMIINGQVTGDVTVELHSQMEQLGVYLARAVADYVGGIYRRVISPLPSSAAQPYKGLYPFELEDEATFFGRDIAREAFLRILLKDRLTVLHARSGEGKTSFMRAGVAPELIRQGRLPVFARAYDDPIRAIKQAIAPPSLGPWPDLLEGLSLPDFLGLICYHLRRQAHEFVVILDQFEEFFIFWPTPEQRRPLIKALGTCYTDQTLPVRFILVIRKDYYSDLGEFQEVVPQLPVFQNQYRLVPMSRDDARRSIVEPVARLSVSVRYDKDLLATLLEDLERSGMELPLLQIICTRLYETLGPGETSLTPATYEKLGRAEGVLGNYLRGVLDNLPGRGATIATDVLKALVSSEGTKQVRRSGELVTGVDASTAELDDVVARLVNARLLRRDVVQHESVYELAHEYLIKEIATWMSGADVELKQVEELFARELKNWHAYHLPIREGPLELLYRYRERLRLDEAWECLLRSALEADCANKWATLAGEAGEKYLARALDDPERAIRQRATEALGQLGTPGAVEPLLAAVCDPDPKVREAAAHMLGTIRDPRAVEPLLAAVRDPDPNVRWAAQRALENLKRWH